MALPRRRAPFWFHLCVAVAAAAALRVLVGAYGVGDAAPGHTAPPSVAFFQFLILIGELIWKGLEVAGKITLEVLHWMVINLGLVVTKIKNGLGALGSDLLGGLKRAWEFTRKLYDDVLKPAWRKFWGWFDKFRAWLDRTFGPVLDWLKRLRDNLLLFYKTWIQPWLDVIDVTRKLLRVLGSLHIGWARALDARLGRVEELIEKPFRLVLAKLNEVIGIVNRIVTIDGLLQRVALIRSLARDVQYVWRAALNPWTRLLSPSEQHRVTQALTTKPAAKVTTDLRTFLATGGGDNAPIVSEWAAQVRIYLRS